MSFGPPCGPNIRIEPGWVLVEVEGHTESRVERAALSLTERVQLPNLMEKCVEAVQRRRSRVLHAFNLSADYAFAGAVRLDHGVRRLVSPGSWLRNC